MFLWDKLIVPDHGLVEGRDDLLQKRYVFYVSADMIEEGTL
jgi:hypothetical protein